MTTHHNGTTGAATPTVRDTPGADQAGALLDELDTLISDLDSAIGEANTARLVIGDAESEQAIIDASVTLGIEGKNESEREARPTAGFGPDLRDRLPPEHALAAGPGPGFEGGHPRLQLGDSGRMGRNRLLLRRHEGEQLHTAGGGSVGHWLHHQAERLHPPARFLPETRPLKPELSPATVRSLLRRTDVLL